MTANSTKRTEAPPVGVWSIDPNHSDLRIIARHLMMTKVRGTFAELTGTIEVAKDLADSTVEIVAQAASVHTGVADRDGHLRSPDFLDAEKYPTVVFKSTEVTPVGHRWKVTGDLTIRDITKPVTFDVTYEGLATDPYGIQKAAFTATGEINREDWGLTWNLPLEGGGILVSKVFTVEFDLQAMRQV
ncbi:MAG: YceI family protein [Acidimicrobiia bacterium]